MKKYLLIFLPIIFMVSFATARASTNLIFTTNVSTGDTCNPIPPNPGCHGNGNALNSLPVNTFTTYLEGSQNGGTLSHYVEIYNASSTLIASSTYVSVSIQAPAFAKFVFPLRETPTLVSGQNYTYKIQPVGGDSTTRANYYATSSYPVLSFDSESMVQTTFLYPENRTDVFIHDFTHFTFKATNPDSVSHDYQFKIIYDASSTFALAPVSVSTNLNYTYLSGITHFHNIPKPENLASSTIYWAKLCTNIDSSATWVCDSPISFKLGVQATGFKINTISAGFNNTTTTEAGIMYPTSTTDITTETGLTCGTEFYNPANWACWVGQRIVLLFNELKDFAVGTFGMGYDFFLQVFPMNVLSQLSADLHSVQYSTSTISNISFTGQGTAYKKAGGGYYTFTFLTSSTLQESETRVGWNWETIVIYLLWAMTGIVIVGSAFALIKHAGHNSTPHA